MPIATYVKLGVAALLLAAVVAFCARYAYVKHELTVAEQSLALANDHINTLAAVNDADRAELARVRQQAQQAMAEATLAAAAQARHADELQAILEANKHAHDGPVSPRVGAVLQQLLSDGPAGGGHAAAAGQADRP